MLRSICKPLEQEEEEEEEWGGVRHSRGHQHSPRQDALAPVSLQGQYSGTAATPPCSCWHAAAARCSKHILRHVQRFKQIYSTHTTTSGMKAHPHASPLPPALDKRGKKQTDVKCVVLTSPPPPPHHPIPCRQPSECVCV